MATHIEVTHRDRIGRVFHTLKIPTTFTNLPELMDAKMKVVLEVDGKTRWYHEEEVHLRVLEAPDV